MKCPFCAEEINDSAIKCRFCGEILKKENYNKVANTFESSDLSDLDPYYKNIFKQIESNSGKFTIVWNWYSFLLGAIWYLVKGMWVKAIVIFIICIVLGGIPVIFFWIYTGLAGNYDYYLLKVKNKQWW